MRTALLAGRDFTRAEDPGASRGDCERTFVRRYLPDVPVCLEPKKLGRIPWA
jgi:hypothetical protein